MRFALGRGILVITVDNLHKAYDQTIAVRGLSFQVQAGQILGLVGPNGAGKTTTMRAISALLPFARGTLTVAGYDVAKNSLAVKQRLAYLPDEPQLFPDLTVEEHITFVASVYGVDNAVEKANRLLEDFNLAAQTRTIAGNLSRGMKQKLAICCAYLYEPSALLFDEPLTGLDPLGIRTFKESILARAKQGAAIIVSSHLLAMVEDICTEVLVLTDGTSKFLGTIAELRNEFAGNAADGSLESVFFKATESETNLELTSL